MEKKGWQTGFVLSDSWRATKKSVSDMANNILEEKEKRKYTAIIFMLLDNNMFFGQSEDGSRGLPKKEADGRYHAEGVIHLADKDGQYAILKLCEPIWETAKDLNMVIISPMARYVTAGCCDNLGHMSNRGKPDFYQQMRLDLVGCALRTEHQELLVHWQPAEWDSDGPSADNTRSGSGRDLRRRPHPPKRRYLQHNCGQRQGG